MLHKNLKKLLILILIIFDQRIYSQTIYQYYYSSPLKIPLYLAGNFGELRANHFHTGIDIKTQGRPGLSVYAAAEGDISRISISPSGYGLALYIDHPNGTTTVYGHLSKLRDDLTNYVKSIQYEKKSFNVDISIPKGEFHIEKGELVAFSGNSGSSGGPHLHFEIRDTQTEHPENPLLYNLGIKDDLAPKILSVMIYPLSEGSQVAGGITPRRVETVFYNGSYQLKGNPVISVFGEIGFSIQTQDFLNGSMNRCGIYEVTLKADDKTVYIFRMDQLSFDETRYVNSLMDYSYYQKYHRKMQKSWVEPGNELHNYPLLVNRGLVNFNDGKTHKMSYIVKDAYGNSNKLDFSVISKQIDVKWPDHKGILVQYDKPFYLKEEGIEADFEKGTFYSDFWMDFQETASNNLFFSPIYRIHHDDVPVQKFYKLRIKADKLPEKLRDKALIAIIDEESAHKWSAGGEYENGWIVTKARQLGRFAVTVDTVAPVITPVNIQNRKTLLDKRKISFKITDNFSGIGNYSGTIDDNWVLFEYDAKNNLLEYYFDPERITPGKNHHLKLEVSDVKGNKKIYEADFYR